MTTATPWRSGPPSSLRPECLRPRPGRPPKPVGNVIPSLLPAERASRRSGRGPIAWRNVVGRAVCALAASQRSATRIAALSLPDLQRIRLPLIAWSALAAMFEHPRRPTPIGQGLLGLSMRGAMHRCHAHGRTVGAPCSLRSMARAGRAARLRPVPLDRAPDRARAVVLRALSEAGLLALDSNEGGPVAP